MALEGIKSSTYQNDIGSVTKQRDAAGRTSEDMTYDSLGNSSKIQSVDEQTSDQNDVNDKLIKDEISKVNTYLKRHNIKCTFDYHDETSRIIIKVMDGDTKEVLREIPPEKALDAVQKMWELAGLLIDERR